VIANQEIVSLLNAALECSIFLSPTDIGLSYDELLELGRRAAYQEGEIGDAARQVGEYSQRYKRIIPNETTRAQWVFLFKEEPDLRNMAAFDFIIAELNDRVKAVGAANAQVERSVVVERAITVGIPRNDIEAAITYQILSEQLAEKNGVVRFYHVSGVRRLPSDQMREMRAPLMQRPARSRAHPLVKDLIERRTDGRASLVEPLDAFAEHLDELGYGRFRLWWTQTVAELRHCDPQLSPTSVTVLAGALVEGALTFVVKHARRLDLSFFRSPDFERPPRSWKIDDLVASASSGGDTAILNPQTKNRAETLIRNRQRVHAGRMLSEFPTGGIPDIRPEEARDAKVTADQVIRCVLDWLQKFPAIS
jgi:hypothetical protein